VISNVERNYSWVDQAGLQAAQEVKRRARGWRMLLLWLWLIMPMRGMGAEEAYQIKAAFIFNFTKFVTWPADMEQQGGDLHLCLLGGNPFGEYVYQLEGRKVRNFSLHVQQIQLAEELTQCQILFVAAKGHQELLSGIINKPVLTISDYDGFTSQGGGIELLSEDNRIRFDINLQRIKASGLDISSRLLHLARQVL